MHTVSQLVFSSDFLSLSICFTHYMFLHIMHFALNDVEAHYTDYIWRNPGKLHMVNAVQAGHAFSAQGRWETQGRHVRGRRQLDGPQST